jgi:hypothetical protein
MTGGVMYPGFTPHGGSEGPCFVPNKKKKKKKKKKEEEEEEVGIFRNICQLSVSLSLSLTHTHTHKMRGDVGSCEGKDKVSLGC